MHCGARGAGRPKFELADIVRAHVGELREQVSLSSVQSQTLADIARCRTAQLGGFLFRCADCGFEQPQYSSCGNRHCPKCQVLEQHKWVEQRVAKVLPVAHFHVVFTLPRQLRALVRAFPKPLYGLLLRASADTLLELACHPRRRGATAAMPGITEVLHTWTRQLQFHPHVHCIVTAGGLSLDGKQWTPPASKKFLFAVKVMAEVFRGKFCCGLRKLQQSGAFVGFKQFDDPQGFDRLMQHIVKIPWHVYAKRTLRNDAHVFRYLGLYTHRVGIANSRLVSMAHGNVTFRSKEGKTHTIAGVEFLRRFVQHVLPRGFVKIRHYGLYASGNVPTKLAQAGSLLTSSTCSDAAAAPSQTINSVPSLEQVTGRDPSHCPRCGSIAWHAAPLPQSRSPPTVTAIAA